MCKWGMDRRQEEYPFVGAFPFSFSAATQLWFRSLSFLRSSSSTLLSDPSQIRTDTHKHLHWKTCRVCWLCAHKLSLPVGWVTETPTSKVWAHSRITANPCSGCWCLFVQTRVYLFGCGLLKSLVWIITDNLNTISQLFQSNNYHPPLFFLTYIWNNNNN